MAHKPTPETRQMVENLAAFGVPVDEIGKMIGVAVYRTMRKHYHAELDSGVTKANAKVAGALFRAATGDGPGAITAQIFWLKTRARWRETSHLELTGRIDSDAITEVRYTIVDPATTDTPEVNPAS